MTTVAVTDTGPLIHLAELDSLDLLEVLHNLVVPEVVYEELEDGGIPEELDSSSYERVTVSSTDSVEQSLDPGETAALAIAMQRDIVLLTDDLAARDAATAVNVEVHGSLGIVALAYARERLDRDEAADRMRALQRETSLFVTEAVVEQGIDLLDGE